LSQLSDFIKIRDDVVPEHICRKAIELFEADWPYHEASKVGADEAEQNQLERATIQQNLIDGKALQHEEFYKSVGTKDLSGRHAIEMNCSQRIATSPDWENLLKYMNHNAVQQYLRYKSEMVEAGYAPYMFPRKFRLESWRMHRYDVGEHFFKDHIDSIDAKSSKRYLAFLYYPNTVTEGGETSFAYNLKGIECHPRQGRLLISPTWMGFPHEGKTPISNTKYLLKTYFHFPEIDD